MIIVVFMIIFMLTYFLATEFVSAKKPNGEALLFRRKHQTPAMDRRRYLETYGYSTDGIDAYGSELTSTIQRQTTIFVSQCFISPHILCNVPSRQLTLPFTAMERYLL